MKSLMLLRALFLCLVTTSITIISSQALAVGDADKGAGIYKSKCSFCHATTAGVHKMGPSMAGIYGMKAGATDFKRYVGLKDADFVWDDETLDGFLENPKEFLGRNTSMPTGTPGADDRAHVIAYLKTLE